MNGKCGEFIHGILAFFRSLMPEVCLSLCVVWFRLLFVRCVWVVENEFLPFRESKQNCNDSRVGHRVICRLDALICTQPSLVDIDISSLVV